jgi:hypothetical protein
MKKFLFTVCLLCTIHQFASARSNLKVYVGSAQNAPTYTTTILMQLIFCNNTFDTMYIKRSEIEQIRPRVTIDVSEIMEGGTRVLLTGISEVGTDENYIRDEIKKGPKDGHQQSIVRERELAAENDKHPQVTNGKDKYFALAPSKCVTINSSLRAADVFYLNLNQVKKAERVATAAYLILPVTYYTNKDKTIKQEILISRSSEDLKSSMFYHNKK